MIGLADMAATTKNTEGSAQTAAGRAQGAEERGRVEAPATGERQGIEALYPPGRRPTHRRGYIDDTLDAYPPYHVLYRGTPTPEQIQAAKRLAQEEIGR